jgi:two-component system response regulator NreC
VRAAADGGTFLNPQLGARIAAAPAEPAQPPDDLTEREVEILRLIALGHTNSEIASSS